MSRAKIKRQQARDADRLAAVASGIGEYGISNACYRLAGILRKQAEEIDSRASFRTFVKTLEAEQGPVSEGEMQAVRDEWQGS